MLIKISSQVIGQQRAKEYIGEALHLLARHQVVEEKFSQAALPGE